MNNSDDNVIQYPGVGTFLYNDTRLYNYAASCLRDGLEQQASLIALCAELYERGEIEVEWDPSTGEPIFSSKKMANLGET